MFLPLILKFKLYFKMNVMILLVLIYFLWPNPEKSRTSFFFSVRLHCVASLCFFFVGKQSRLRKDACLFAKRCICQYPRGSFFFTFLTSFYFFFFNYRLLISAYRLKEVLDRIASGDRGAAMPRLTCVHASAVCPDERRQSTIADAHWQARSEWP